MAGKEVVVVGAGPGGLTCAMILAYRGFKVKVFERKNSVGGRNAAIKLQQYTFDAGPTFLMMKFILEEMFQEAGKKAEDYLEFKRIEPMYRLDYGDIQINPSSDFEAEKKEIERLFPEEKKGLEKFYVKEKNRYEKLFPCLQKDYVHFKSFLSLDFIKAIPILGIGESLYQNLGKYFRDEKLRLSFTFQSKYLGMSPWECPAGFTMIPYVERRYGIYHVVGGLNRISEAMAEVVLEYGGEIFLGKEVKKLLIEGRKTVGVELTDGEKHFGDEVVLNSDFGYSVTHLFREGFLKKYSPQKVARKKYSCSTFMLYLGVDKKYNLPHHSIYFAEDYRRNVEDIFHNMKLSDGISFYIQNASITDDSLAPEGKSTIYILVPVPNNFSRIDWEKEKKSFRDKVLSEVVRRTPMKDLREHIECEKIITPQDWENEYNVYAGATFNLAHNITQMLYFRPRNKFEEADNCYLVGGGTHPGSGLPTIYESARITANLISKKYGVKYTKPSRLSSKKQ